CTVCSPTRASIMSGQAPARLHLTDWIKGYKLKNKPLLSPQWTPFLTLETKTVAEYLQEAGQQTAHIGKWHLGEEEKYEPQHQGFDVNIAGYKKGQPPSYFFPYKRKNWKPIPYLEGGKEGEYLTYRLTEEANNFIRNSSKKDSPFFLYLSHYTVHTPLQAPDSLIKYYEERVDMQAKQKNPTYASMVHSMDQSLGRVRAVLDSLGEWENTMLIFASDNGGLSGARKHNGPTSNAPLREGKGTAYEGGIRTPLIIHYPGKYSKGKTTSSPAISMDIFYTILDVAGIKQAFNHEDGVSLLALKDSTSKDLSNRSLFWHYPHYHVRGATPHSAIRKGDFKLIEFYEDGRLELYNLADDIGEQTDLSTQRPKVRKQLYRELKRWKKAVDAQPPLENPDYQP
ncbi:MAG: sulfatase, partial [Bacteroidota bacterium]